MNEAPRVAHILEATVGGTARHLTEIGCELAGLGIPQEAILSRRAEESFAGRAERLARAGVRITWVPMTREIAPGADLRALWQLIRCLRRSRPEIVHTHSSKAGILGRAAALLAGVPVLIHSPPSLSDASGAPARATSHRTRAARKTRVWWPSRMPSAIWRSIGGYRRSAPSSLRTASTRGWRIAAGGRGAAQEQLRRRRGRPLCRPVGGAEGTRRTGASSRSGAGRAPGGALPPRGGRPTLRRDAAAGRPMAHPGPTRGQSGAHPAAGAPAGCRAVLRGCTTLRASLALGGPPLLPSGGDARRAAGRG